MDYYQILGVEPTVKLEGIRDAYKKLALKIHPDRALINKAIDASDRDEGDDKERGEKEEGDA